MNETHILQYVSITIHGFKILMTSSYTAVVNLFIIRLFILRALTTAVKKCILSVIILRMPGWLSSMECDLRVWQSLMWWIVPPL